MVFPLLTSGCDGEQLFLQLLLPAAHLPQLSLKIQLVANFLQLSLSFPFLGDSNLVPLSLPCSPNLQFLAPLGQHSNLTSVSIWKSVLSVKYHFILCSISFIPVPAWLWFSLQEQKLLPQPSPSRHQPPPSPNAGKISNWKYCGNYICWWWTGTNQKIGHGLWKLFSSPATVAAWSCLAPSASPSPPPPASPQ